MCSPREFEKPMSETRRVSISLQREEQFIYFDFRLQIIGCNLRSLDGCLHSNEQHCEETQLGPSANTNPHLSLMPYPETLLKGWTVGVWGMILVAIPLLCWLREIGRKREGFLFNVGATR